MEVSSLDNHLFLWAIYTMAMFNNQRDNMLVIDKWMDFAMLMDVDTW